MENWRKRKATEEGNSRCDGNDLARIRASAALRSQFPRETDSSSSIRLEEIREWRRTEADIDNLLAESRQRLAVGERMRRFGNLRGEGDDFGDRLSSASMRYCPSANLAHQPESRERKRPVILTRDEADRRLAIELSRPLLPSLANDESARVDLLRGPNERLGGYEDLLQERRRMLEQRALLDRQLEALLAQPQSSPSAFMHTTRPRSYPNEVQRSHILQNVESALTRIHGADRGLNVAQSSSDVASAVATGRCALASKKKDPPRSDQGRISDGGQNHATKTPKAKASKDGRVREEDRWTKVPKASQVEVPNQGKGHVIPLSSKDDRANLTPYQAAIRESLEYFTATEDDVATKIQGRRKPVVLNQLGIRCKYCSHLPVCKRMRAAAYYPRTLPNLYQGAQNIAGIHFPKCTEFPKHILDFLTTERPRKVFSKFGRPYWADMCLELGIYEEDHALWLSSVTGGGRTSGHEEAVGEASAS